jgi:hypothetical protein
MTPFWLQGERPRLLVSVRSADEALAALAGGADVIDVKEPSRGPLGPADALTIANVVRVVAGRALVTAAAGELLDFLSGPSGSGMFDSDASAPPRSTGRVNPPATVALWKFGLASCGREINWQTNWRHAVAELATGGPAAAVVYADWKAASAPDPLTVLTAAIAFGCPALLVDTWDKAGGSLFELWPSESLAEFVEQAHQRGLAVALAGSLSRADISRAVELGPDLIAVRGAACEGGRNGIVTRAQVQTLRELLNRAASSDRPVANEAPR